MQHDDDASSNRAIACKQRHDIQLVGKIECCYWFVSQQEPTDDERVNAIDAVAAVEAVAAADPRLIHVKAFGLPGREKKLVISTKGIVALGELLAERFLAQSSSARQKKNP